MKKALNCNVKYGFYILACFMAIMLMPKYVLAGGSENWGDVATGITKTFTAIGRLISGGSYLAGLGFSIGAIMKFKQHKDNPSQTPVGTPIALVFVAASLLFLPSVLKSTGATMFQDAKTAGPSGVANITT